MISRLDAFVEPYKGYANFFLRLVIGWRLIVGAQDNVFNWDRMLEFREFLIVQGVPFPLLAALVSVYAQFICGILYLTGCFIRPAALVMTINFIAALLIVHIGHPFEQAFAAWMMLAGSLFFLLNGAGKLSIDELRRNRNSSV